MSVVFKIICVFKMPVDFIDLPLEIIEMVLWFLDYEDILNVRKTCKYLNDVGRDLHRSSLRRIRRQVTEAVRRYCSVRDWRRGQNYDLRRLTKGAGSLLKLAAIIEVVDAETYHLVKDGVLPPLPGAILSEFNVAVKLATRRNPLVGRVRINNLLRQLQQYWANGVSLRRAPVNDTVLYYTIVDLLDCLPRTKVTIETTEYGIQVTCGLLTTLLPLYPPLPFGYDPVFGITEEMGWIKSAGIHLFKYIPTCAGSYASAMQDSGHLEGFLAVNELTLQVICAHPGSLPKLSQLKDVAVRGFRLVNNTEARYTILAMSYQCQDCFT